MFVVMFVALLVRGSPKASANFVWGTFINETGWPDGACFLIGTETACFMYLGLDGAMHVAEECVDAAKTVPRAIMSAITIGFCTAFPFTVAVLYSVTDIDAILSTSEQAFTLIRPSADKDTDCYLGIFL